VKYSLVVIAACAMLWAPGPSFAQSTAAPAAPAATVLHANAAFPSPLPSAPIADWVDDAGRTTVTVDSAGTTLRGWLYPGSDPSSKLVVLYFYGNGGTIDRYDEFMHKIAALGPRVITFDYRGYGFSSGTADLLTIREDALLEFDLATQIAGDPGHVVVLGFSMGTAVASYVASQRKIGALALIAPIATVTEEYPYYAVANGMSPKEAAALVPAPDAHQVFDEVDLVDKSTAPLVVIHGDADELVSYAQGKEVLAASTGNPKHLVTLPGIHHNDAPMQPATFDALAALFATVCAPGSTANGC
jgi:pimeloyl-ACP methyl ester carboxylesterase